MSLTLYIIVAVVVMIFFYLVKLEGKKSEKNMDEKCFSIQQPLLYLIVSIICTLLFAAITVWTILFPNDTMEWWVYLVFSAFTVLGLLMFIYCIRWKIEINGENIIYNPFIGKIKNITFKEIQKVKIHSNNKVEVYQNDKKVFAVEPFSKGCNVLISRLKNEQVPIE